MSNVFIAFQRNEETRAIVNAIRAPLGWEQACKEKDHLSHQAWNVFYNYGAAAPFHTWAPSEEDMKWLAAK